MFLLGEDYHLGDLLWLTAVLAEYRRQYSPERLLVGLPDRPVSRILERNPLIDELRYGEAGPLLRAARAAFGRQLFVRDLRPLALARAMLRDWRHYWPWLYYRDLWLAARGQWLATFLHLGRLSSSRPIMPLGADDRAAAHVLAAPYIVLAPHIGRYRLPGAGALWRRLKDWGDDHWCELAARLRAAGYTPVTLAAADQAPVAGSESLLGLPIRQAAGVIAGAAALVSVESGLWYLAAATGTPFVIVPWWLPRSVDWAAAMQTPHRLLRRRDAAVGMVVANLDTLIAEVGRRPALASD